MAHAIDFLAVANVGLGSRHCDIDAFIDFLQHAQRTSPRLVIAGDLVEHWHTERWPLHHLTVLNYLVASGKKGWDITWVAGDRDGDHRFIRDKLGIPLLSPAKESGLSVCRNLIMVPASGESVYVTHGHLADEEIPKNWVWTRVGRFLAGKVPVLKNRLPAVAASLDEIAREAVDCNCRTAIYGGYAATSGWPDAVDVELPRDGGWSRVMLLSPGGWHKHRVGGPSFLMCQAGLMSVEMDWSRL